MALSHGHVGSKIPAKINTNMLTRAELLITLYYERYPLQIKSCRSMVPPDFGRKEAAIRQQLCDALLLAHPGSQTQRHLERKMDTKNMFIISSLRTLFSGRQRVLVLPSFLGSQGFRKAGTMLEAGLKGLQPPGI